MRTIGALLLLTLALAMPAGALADATVVVLGLRSVEGDDDLANAVTEELRSGAKEIAGWEVLDRSVSMSQMSLAHGCEDIDAACLSEIAQGLGSERIIYGTIRRTSARDDYDFNIDLSIFDASSGRIENSVAGVVPQADAETDALGSHVMGLLSRLSGAHANGTILVQTNVSAAQVALNGQHVGDVVEGRLLLEQVQPGSYEVEIASEGFRTYRAVVAVQEGTETTVAASLNEGQGVEAWQRRDAETDFRVQDAGGSGPPLWVGYSLLGVAGASLVGMVVSWVMINSIESNELYTDYRAIVDAGNQGVPSSQQEDDVCAAANDGKAYSLSESEVQEVADMCGRADTFEVLQWVFLGVGVVSGGVGVLMLVLHEEPTEAQTSLLGMPLAIKPSVGTQSAKLTATLRF